jgi:hypothetical protein
MRRRIRFIATSQSLDVRLCGDTMSRLILGVLASVAEFERDSRARVESC